MKPRKRRKLALQANLLLSQQNGIQIQKQNLPIGGSLSLAKQPQIRNKIHKIQAKHLKGLWNLPNDLLGNWQIHNHNSDDARKSTIITNSPIIL